MDSDGSQDGRSDSVTIHQDVALYVAYISKGTTLEYAFKERRSGWVQLIKGKIKINESDLFAGDGVAIAEENKIAIKCQEEAELLLFDIL